MKEDVTKSEKITEHIIQWTAIIAGVLGVAILLYFGYLLWNAGDRPKADFNGERTGQVGDFIGGVSGSLFALAAGLLFYLTLTLQRREFKNSLDELTLSRKALATSATHQENTLNLMRQEKEFAICLQAIQNIKEETDSLEFSSGIRGFSAIPVLVDVWSKWTISSYDGYASSSNRYPFAVETDIDKIYRKFTEVGNIMTRMQWIKNAIESKAIANDDRDYLRTLIEDDQEIVQKATIILIRMNGYMCRILKKDDAELATRRILRNAVVMQQSKVEKLIGRATSKA